MVVEQPAWLKAAINKSRTPHPLQVSDVDFDPTGTSRRKYRTIRPGCEAHFKFMIMMLPSQESFVGLPLPP
jgi:hypothetical protein